MIDREKVIKGLGEALVLLAEYVPGERYLGYAPGACLDAIEMLKAQQPRVMTLEDVENTIKELAPLWVELHPIINDSEGGSAWRMGWTYSKFGKPKKYIMENYISRLTLTEPTYGKTWRCWTSRPDEKVRAETAWASDT